MMTEMGRVRDRRCRNALDLLESKRLADGTFPVEWTNVKEAGLTGNSINPKPGLS